MTYSPALDGVRALSALAVLAYHSTYGHLPGGLLGVDVFFAISGFLITRNLLLEHDDSGRLNFGRFYVRRARRLLPALLLGLLLAYVLWPAGGPSYARPALGTLLYYANWIHVDGGREAMGLLAHTWSLSVEEQFYIFWPFVMAFLLRRLPNRSAMASALASALVILIVVRLVLHQEGSRLAAYASTLTRMDQILWGAFFAVLQWRNPQFRVPWLGCYAATAFLAFLLFWRGAHDVWLYRWGFSLVALAAAILVSFTVASPQNLLTRALAFRPLVEIGKRSYGVYLFHYPIVEYLEQFRIRGSLLNFALVLALRIGLTLTLAWASYAWIESRFLRQRASVPASTAT